ncbi:GGDEF domain-containing protein [uncultured Cohaesibacter sp.]|uniref:GGDEF domain-containing protein n=1 Tax=uncultured Cohaesibacter sp. TaxID=1002546 RepID=UPI00293023A5|nr:GGDEF domain-containing protein [uncultured Cohaesibacter sp.]
MFISAVTMIFVWLGNFKEKAAGYWSLTYVLAVIASVILANLDALGPQAVAISTTFSISAYMFSWAGFRAFNGQSVSIKSVIVVPTLYLIVVVPVLDYYAHYNLNVAMQSLVVAAIALVSAFYLVTNPRNRGLSMVYPAAVMLVVHGAFRLTLIYFIFSMPATMVDGRLEVGWWKFYLLESFLSTIMIMIGMIVLIKDRVEQRYKIASETDMLTGIANRRAFVNKAEQRLNDASEETTLAIFDIDFFKKINDTFGHAGGDQILIDFAKLVRKALPRDALFGRMGGEEFAVLLSGRCADHESILERVRHTIAVTSFSYNDMPITLTTSAGFASVKIAGDTFDQLFTAADCALYLAKRNGRNKVMVFVPSLRIRELLDEERLLYGDLPDPRLAVSAV